MPVTLNPKVSAIEEPPVLDAANWVCPENFGPDKPLINVSQAVPGYAPAPDLMDHLATVVHENNSAFYTGVQGIDPLRDALARTMSTVYKGALTAPDVMITAGCNQAFYIAMTTLVQPGQSVVLPWPWYFNHRMTLDMLGIRVIPLPCHAESGMIPDPVQLADVIADDTAAIVLVTPNNPTGAVYPPAVIAAVHAIAKGHGISLVLDETYRDFLPVDYGPPHALFSDAGWRDSGLVHLYSFSKVFSLTGYRTGALVAAPRIVEEAAKVMDCLAICAPHVGQRAALFGLEQLGEWCAEKRDLMAGRVAAFREAMTQSNSGYQVRSMGAYFAYVEHPFSGQSSRAVAQRLAREQNLSCMSGDMFSPGNLPVDQDRMLRFAFANVETEIMPALARRLSADTASLD